jgi:signal transduction histidine kinase
LVALAFGLMVAASALLAWAGPPAPGAPASSTATTGPGLLLLALPLVALVGGTGVLIIGRYPRNALGWMFVGFAVLTGLATLTYAYGYAGLVARPGSLPGAGPVELLGELLWLPMIAIQAVGMLVLFPEGRPVSAARRRLLALGASGVAAGSLGALVEPTLYAVKMENPLSIGSPTLSGTLLVIGSVCVLASALGAAVSLIRRFRRSRGDDRLQMKWFVYAAGLVLAVEIPLFFLETWSVWVQALFALSLALLPLAVGVGILRHRLFDIDLVVSKAFVYGSLAAFIALVYVAIAVGVGTLIGSRGSPALSAAAAAVVALAFQPVRRSAQRIANRLVYGERASPYEVLSGFSDMLADSYSVEDVLPRMARVIAEGTGAAGVTIWLAATTDLRPVAAWPSAVEPAEPAPSIGALPDHAFQVRHQGGLLGAITVAMAPSEPMTSAKERLVDGLAAQAGLVLSNVRLVEELRESRRRIVSAQDERAKKLERNIHDGAQQQLVALAVKLKLADALVGRDEGRAHGLLAELHAETNRALEDLRDLARGIYPPLLADKGLASALESQARKYQTPVAVASDGIGRYPQEVEAAVYFSCLEALQNVAKYAQASSATIRLAQADGTLTFEVTDDGVGFDPGAASHGSGLQGITDRLAALGGELEVRSAPGDGTTVAGRVPVEGGSR